MIFTFRFISDEEDTFVIDININHDQTFEELHNKIQETLDYDPSQMASFFVSNEAWEKIEEIGQIGLGDDSDVRYMSQTTIGEMFFEKNQRLMYIFDYFSERLLFGSVIRLIDAPSPITLPSVSKFEGKKPEQVVEISDPGIKAQEEDPFHDDEFEDGYDDGEDQNQGGNSDYY